MKDGCPSCDDKDQQQMVGQVERHSGDGTVTPTLYRCGHCGFLYLVPPIDDDQERFAWQRKQE